VAVSAVLISLIPLIYLLVRVATIGISELLELIFQVRTLELIINSLSLAVAVSVSAVLLGSMQAWVAVRSNLPGRRVFSVLAALPLAIPSYVAAYAWIAVIPGFSGFLAAWLLLTVGTAPLVYLAVSAALVRFDAGTEEVAQSLGATKFQVFRRVTWPNIRTAAVSGGLLSALYVLSDFGAVSIVRYDTFTRAIYNAYRASFDRNQAAALALVLVLVTVLVLYFESRARGRTFAAGKIASRLGLVELGAWKVPMFLLLLALATVSLLVPLGSLLRWSIAGFGSVDWVAVLGALANSVGLAVSGGLLT
jgi:iron(III) transport system permease protein